MRNRVDDGGFAAGVPEDLLSPVLAQRSAQAPYSVQAHMWVAILGGLFASLLLCIASARRLGVASRDRIAIAATVLLAAAAIAGLAWAVQTDQISTRVARYAQQLLGVGTFGVFYLRHRASYKAVSLSGDDFPESWRSGAICVLVGWAIAWVSYRWLG